LALNFEDNVSGETKEVEKNTKPAHFPRKRTKPAQFSSRFATYHAHIPGEDSETLMFPSLCRASLLNLRLFLALLLFFFFFSRVD
jgi:hypothetical protein